MKRVAVIGAGAAGCFCAARLARLEPDCRITLFVPKDFFLKLS